MRIHLNLYIIDLRLGIFESYPDTTTQQHLHAYQPLAATDIEAAAADDDTAYRKEGLLARSSLDLKEASDEAVLARDREANVEFVLGLKGCMTLVLVVLLLVGLAVLQAQVMDDY